ncbi:unnamed protein product [Clonostachys solani]|uniref:Uncharacterized protein n=1 Tax=Clonostachys solani TaxID=160281 RepID=A0A9N9ZFL4_9HYPO|nr:unnamed protein product [Clonostachys solani]
MGCLFRASRCCSPPAIWVQARKELDILVACEVEQRSAVPDGRLVNLLNQDSPDNPDNGDGDTFDKGKNATGKDGTDDDVLISSLECTKLLLGAEPPNLMIPNSFDLDRAKYLQPTT